MKYLLDTCVISELVRPKPATSVANWIREQQEDLLHFSVLTLGELRKGIDRLPEGRKRVRLENWLNRDLRLRFIGRWLPIDEEIAERWGLMNTRAIAQGRAMPVIDSLIAATALVHGMTVVTRNTDDMQPSGVLLLNPWTAY